MDLLEAHHILHVNRIRVNHCATGVLGIRVRLEKSLKMEPEIPFEIAVHVDTCFLNNMVEEDNFSVLCVSFSHSALDIFFRRVMNPEIWKKKMYGIAELLEAFQRRHSAVIVLVSLLLYQPRTGHIVGSPAKVHVFVIRSSDGVGLGRGGLGRVGLGELCLDPIKFSPT